MADALVVAVPDAPEELDEVAAHVVLGGALVQCDAVKQLSALWAGPGGGACGARWSE